MPPLVRALLLSLAVLQSHATSADQAPGLKVEFRTRNGSSIFHVGEVIPIEVSFSSRAPHRYLAPCKLFWHPGFGFPRCYFETPRQFTITPAQGWEDRSADLIPMTEGGPQFDVPTQSLTPESVTARETLSDLFRFSQPGEYKVRLTVEVALDDHKPHKPDDGFRPKTVSVSRELMVHIVPVDADWEQGIIRKGVQAVSASEDGKALCYLGTRKAAVALARLATQDRAGYQCLSSSPSVEAGIEEMQRLLVDPETPVTPQFFDLLVALLNRTQSLGPGVMMISQKSVDEQREVLFQALPGKQAHARIISLMTVLANPPRVLPIPAGIMHFQEPVIAALVQNWNDIPENFKVKLINDLWPGIQSPLMVPILRSRAEAGDRNALQRWMEIDAPAAMEFVKSKK